MRQWRSYLSGQYVCLRSVRPDTIVRKDGLTSAIAQALADPKPESMLWRARLHILVDELESVELPFTGYDRLRFCGPTSRDTLIDSVRARFPLDIRRSGRTGGRRAPCDLGVLTPWGPRKPALTSRFAFVEQCGLIFRPATYRVGPVGISDPGPFDVN